MYATLKCESLVHSTHMVLSSDFPKYEDTAILKSRRQVTIKATVMLAGYRITDPRGTTFHS